MREIILPGGEPAKKLGSFLKREFPIGYVRKLFRKNGVRINGRRAGESDIVRGGDRIQLYLPFAPSASAALPGPSGSRIETIFEDGALLVINKPPGIAVHEGKTVRKRESILGILEDRYRGTGLEPILVHRLDRDTSGLLIIAKSRETAEALKSKFESGTVAKEYLCLVVGRLPQNEGRIDFPLPGRQGNLVRALTRYRVIKRLFETTLARVQIETGRLHQIRLHFAKLGYPVVLDDQHGDFSFNKRLRKQSGLKRQFLHAEKLTLQYNGKQRHWTAPLPEDLQEVLPLLENSPS